MTVAGVGEDSDTVGVAVATARATSLRVGVAGSSPGGISVWLRLMIGGGVLRAPAGATGGLLPVWLTASRDSTIEGTTAQYGSEKRICARRHRTC